MKIALVSSPYSLDKQHQKSKTWSKIIPRIHSLGLGYIAASLEQENHQIKVLDANSEWLNEEDIVAGLVEFQPGLVGVSATTPAFVTARGLLERIRAVLPEAVIILGGAHVTADPEHAMRTSAADIGVIGEGEAPSIEIAAWIEGGKSASLDGIKGIVYRNGSGVVHTAPRGYVDDVNTLPFPARHLMAPMETLQPMPASFMHKPSANMITSRGCPYRCTFCDRAIFGNKVRATTAERVVDEFEELVVKFGAKDVKFYDDTFTANKNRVYRICDELIKRGLNKIPWACLTAVKSTTPDILKRMKEAGCWQVLYGLEHSDPRMLKLLSKGNTRQDNIDGVTWAHEAGLSVRGDFIVGTPGETRESLEDLLDFVLSLPLDYAHFNPFVPLPGTEIYDNLLKERGVNDFYNYDKDAGSAIDPTSIEFVPEGLDRDFYKAFLTRAHKTFYYRPGYLWKRLRAIRSKDQFMGHVYGALAVFDL